MKGLTLVQPGLACCGIGVQFPVEYACFQSDPAGDARPLRFPKLAAPGSQAALSFRGLLWATDRGQTVEALESSPSPHHRTTRKRPFGFRRCYSGLTGSFEQEAVSGCRMVVVGSRPSTDVAPEKISRRERQVTDLEPAVRLPADSGRSPAVTAVDPITRNRAAIIAYLSFNLERPQTAAPLSDEGELLTHRGGSPNSDE